MERIVHGHYADDNSTRDIVGITTEEFGCLITVLQNYYQQIDLVYSLPEEERIKLILQNVHSLNNNGSEFDPENFTPEKIEKALDFMAAQHEIVYRFLVAINQPYPGATYNPPGS